MRHATAALGRASACLRLSPLLAASPRPHGRCARPARCARCAGLFRSVRLVAKPPSSASAPAFALRGGALQTVAPLDAIEFVVAPRQLPAIAQLSVRAEAGVAPPGQEAVVAAQAAAAAAGAGVGGYLAARATLLKALPEGVDVAFEGVEGGKPTAVLQPLPAGALRERSGGGLGVWEVELLPNGKL